MLTRTISAFVAIAIFLVVVYCLPMYCFPIAVSAICVFIAYELTWRSGIVKVRALSVCSMLTAAATPFFVSFEILNGYMTGLVFACMAIMFIVWLMNYEKANLVMTMTSIFGGVILPIMFSLVIPLRMAEKGDYLILMPFLAAWMTDTGAYFAGSFFGRHKLCEKISPKKTVEGAIGGIVVCIVTLVLFAYFIKLDVNLIAFGAISLVLSVLAQAGDLSFSIIKREYNIKDYGFIMPGHGGVLDRFDSTMFTIPATYFLLMIIGGII